MREGSTSVQYQALLERLRRHINIIHVFEAWLEVYGPEARPELLRELEMYIERADEAIKRIIRSHI